MMIPPVNSVENLRGPKGHYALATHAIANTAILPRILHELPELPVTHAICGLALAIEPWTSISFT
jgi:hypothetical protein